MKKIKLICSKCGWKFEEEVFDPGEAREKGLPTRSIRCPKCGGKVEKRMY